MDWSRLNSLTLRQLRVFCMVARLLSYTRDAGELGCQQPTVSAQVRLDVTETYGEDHEHVFTNSIRETERPYEFNT